MQYKWDEDKRMANLKSHGLDFVDAPKVFAGPPFTFEDDRFAHQEQRFVSLGLLMGIPVTLVNTESPVAIRLIPFGRATTHETAILLEKIFDQLPAPSLDEKRGHTAHRRAPRSRRKADRPRHRARRPKGRST